MKKIPYGMKRELIWRWLEENETKDSGYSNCFIAQIVGCHNTYVGMVREDFMKRVPKETLKAAIKQWGSEADELLLTDPITPENTPSLSVAEVSDIVDTRHKQYGVFAEVSKTAVAIKLAVGDGIEENVYPLADDQQEALDLIATKMARIAHGDPDIIDHWDDIAGYAMLVADRLKGRSR